MSSQYEQVPQRPRSSCSTIILRRSLSNLRIVNGYQLLAVGKGDLKTEKEKRKKPRLKKQLSNRIPCEIQFEKENLHVLIICT